MPARPGRGSSCSTWTWLTSGTALPACPGFRPSGRFAQGALEETGACAAEMVADLQASRDHGLAHVEDLAEEWSERIAVPRDTIRFYLTNNIHYILDEACLRGLDMFYRLAAECGALPPAPRFDHALGISIRIASPGRSCASNGQ